MRTEDGFVVIDAGQDWSVLVKVQPGDEWSDHGSNWTVYPSYCHDATFTGFAPFRVRRSISRCSADLLAKAYPKHGLEAHFI